MIFLLYALSLSLLIILLYNLGTLVLSYWLMRLNVNYTTDIPVSFDDISHILNTGYFVGDLHTLIFWKNDERLYIKGNKIIHVEEGYSRCCYIKNFKDYLKFVFFIKGYKE